MDIRQLRYFVQIVESGSLSKASRQLYIAQPALSQQLAKLEDQVGKPLFLRSSKGVSPTENGLALYHHARFMLRQLDQALSIARAETGAVQGIDVEATAEAMLAYFEGVMLMAKTRNDPDVLRQLLPALAQIRIVHPRD